MDFVDYGDFATFLHIQDTFRVFRLSFFRNEEKEEQTSEMVKESIIPERIAFLGHRE